MTTQDELDGLISASYTCLQEIEAGRVENLEKVLGQNNQLLMNYMQAREIRDLARQEQEKLHQLLANQQTAIKIITDQKRQLASRLKELRNGRNLTNTYKNISV